MKVNKSGHYVWSSVNGCSLVSLCFKERGGRCNHEESPCLFFSCDHRGGKRRGGGGRVSHPAFLLLLSDARKHPSSARPVFLKHAGRERSMVSSERGITPLNFDEHRRKGRGRGEQAEAVKACEKRDSRSCE